ncbi:MAG: hypothetical protein ACKN81_21000 [Pirellulaceae bacterium]
MSKANLVVAFIAGFLGLTWLAAAIWPRMWIHQWRLSDAVDQKFGSRGLRVLDLAMAALMLWVIYRLMMQVPVGRP